MDPESGHISGTLDRAAFESLFKSHYKGLCLFATQYIKDSDKAREIVQEVFFNLWQKKETIDLTKPVHSYLTTSVRNRSLNWLRDQKKYTGELLDFENHYARSEGLSADRLVENELQKRIEDAIGELPQKCREIFLLSRNDSLKYQEIADKLEISVKTVETQISKALQHMRVRLAEFL